MKKWLIIFSFFNVCVYAQNVNLVPNYSFEEATNCYPGAGGNFQYIEDWYSATNLGTPDFYALCGDIMQPSTINAVKRHSGLNRVGLFTYNSASANIREYIAVTFIDTLKVNLNYCLNYFLIPVKNVKYATNDFGAYFGLGHQFYTTNYNITQVTPQLNIPSSVFINDTANWYHYKGIYTAMGNETDIVLGSFKDDNNISLQIIDTYINAQSIAYLVIDDVSLYEMSINSGNDAVTCPQNIIATIGEINLDTAFKSYYWYDEGGVLFDSVNAQIQVQPLTNTFYVQEKRMCGQSLFDTVYVKIDTVCPPEPTTPEIELVIPNVFSPNGDGLNDAWKIELPSSNTLQSVEIYDRWGIKIAVTSDLTTSPTDKTKTIQWFGRTTSGLACSDGVYYYMLELKNSKGEIEKHKGYISLFR